MEDQLLGFKTDRVREEWGKMMQGTKPAFLVPVVVTFAAYSIDLFGVRPIITMIWRTRDEQKALLIQRNKEREEANLEPVSLAMRSVHEFWRGVDFRSRIYSDGQIDELCEKVNGLFQYGKGLQILAFHLRGSSVHLHLQVPGTSVWRM